jgi:hypothetical protein
MASMTAAAISSQMSELLTWSQILRSSERCVAGVMALGP